PTAKGSSGGYRGSHIAPRVSWTDTTMNQQQFDMATASMAEFTKGAKSRAELLAWFDNNAKSARAALNKPDADYNVPWTLKHGEKVFFTLPRYTCVRSFCLNHIVHHRAQLGVYLRMNNVPVPGVYGPSADEQ